MQAEGPLMMSDHTLIYLTCRRIRDIFSGSLVKYSVSGNGGDMSVKVNVSFTIPEENLDRIECDLGPVRKHIESLCGE